MEYASTIASRPQDTYAESRQRIRELTLYAKQVLKAPLTERQPRRTLMMGGSNGEASHEMDGWRRN